MIYPHQGAYIFISVNAYAGKVNIVQLGARAGVGEEADVIGRGGVYREAAYRVAVTVECAGKRSGGASYHVARERHARRIYAGRRADYADFDRAEFLGEAGGGHSNSGHYTNPDEAVKFVKESGVDSLAVAIGNSHGAYKFKGEQHLDLERLKAIKKALMDAGLGDYPLVLHGASSVPQYLVAEINKYGGKMPDAQGVPEADIEVARRVGCTKVNIDTDLRLAMTAGIRKVFTESPKEFDPRKYLGPARACVKDLVRHKVKDVLC